MPRKTARGSAAPAPPPRGPGALRPGAAPWWRQPALLLILALCLGPGLVLEGADLGIWGGGRWRMAAYEIGAFWPGLLRGWRPDYAGQPVLMFLTYGFLHAGPWHLVLNMLTLVSLGALLGQRLGQARFLLLYGAAVLGGAVGYALLAPGPQPMVGASGGLFGLAGGVVGLQLIDRRAAGAARTEVLSGLLRAALGLIVLNVAMYWAMRGQLAWQTHLGGFLAGFAALLAFRARLGGLPRG